MTHEPTGGPTYRKPATFATDNATANLHITHEPTGAPSYNPCYFCYHKNTSIIPNRDKVTANLDMTREPTGARSP